MSLLRKMWGILGILIVIGTVSSIFIYKINPMSVEGIILLPLALVIFIQAIGFIIGREEDASLEKDGGKKGK